MNRSMRHSARFVLAIILTSLIAVFLKNPSCLAEESDENTQVMNILLIGTDERSEEYTENARSDCMILVSINSDSRAIKLVSFERAIGVKILEGVYAGQYDWLTHIFRYGGTDLVIKTIESNFDIEIDAHVHINFNAVSTAIDAIGGVDIELSEAEANYLMDPDSGYIWLGEERRTVRAGMNHMDGTTALTYARIRAIDSDWKRVERQRKVIIAAMNQLKAASLPELAELVRQVLPSVETDLSALSILELAMLATDGGKDLSIDQMTIPQKGTYGTMTGMGGRSLYSIDFEANIEILREFLYPDS